MARKVLVIEDDLAVAELVEMVLNTADLDVALAFENHLVMEAVDETNPDLVLIGSPDPRRYGLDWDLALDLHRLVPRIPLVMLTANFRDALEVGVTERGKIFSGAVSMPFDIDTLLSTVESASQAGSRGASQLVSQLC